MQNTYTTKTGDVWDKIAFDILGSSRYTPLLMRANTAHIRTTVFPKGVTLVLPEIPQTESETAAPRRRDTV